MSEKLSTDNGDKLFCTFVFELREHFEVSISVKKKKGSHWNQLNVDFIDLPQFYTFIT